MIHWSYLVLLAVATVCGCKAVWGFHIHDSFDVMFYSCLSLLAVLGIVTLLMCGRGDGSGKGGSYA